MKLEELKEEKMKVLTRLLQLQNTLMQVNSQIIEGDRILTKLSKDIEALDKPKKTK